MPLYDVGYVDCPWSFNDKGSRVAPDNEACGDGYETLTVEELCDMNLGRFFAPNAALFFWTTSTHILNCQAQQVTKAWGFEGKVIVPWAKLTDTPGKTTAAWKDFPTVEWVYRNGAKIQIGAGHYVRACVEPLIIATRGSMVVPPELRVPGFIAAPRPGGHSSKPHCVYNLIEHSYPDKQYLEFFARDADPRTNWRFVGRQAQRHREAG